MSDAALVQLVGIMAALASTVSFAPQAWKIIWTRDVRGLSAGMYVLTVSAFALWLGYGILRGDWALIVPNALCLLLSLFILAMVLVSARTRVRIAQTLEHGLPKRLDGHDAG
ncbi:MAG: SemiSWEET family sugar transporter [Chakrabartia sp.]